MSIGGGAPVRRPLLEKLLAILTCSNGVPRRSSRENETKSASKDTSKKTRVSGAHGKGKSVSESSTGTDWKQPITAHSSNPFSKQAIQQQQAAKPINPNPNPSARIANYEPPAPQTRRAGSVSASRNNNNASAMKRGGSKSHSAPTSGELMTMGSPSMKKSSSRGMAKLRDHYVGAMMRLGDMTNSVNLGNSVSFESQVFESEVIRKRSQMENEMMEFYLHSSIQPGEWKDAHMGSRINRNPSITV